jgi:tetratricopeptide (TPR) repeat protein
MPRLEDIDQFVSTLNSLGGEPAILAERAESIEPVSVPEAGISGDLKDLFGDPGTDEGGSLETSLAGFGDEPGEQEEGAASADEEPLDFSSIFETPGEEPEAPEPETPDLPATTDGNDLPEDFSLEDEFSLPPENLDLGEEPVSVEEDLLAGFGADILAERGEEEPAAEEVGPEDFTLEDEFTLPVEGLDLDDGSVPEEGAAEEEDLFQVPEEFSLPADFGADEEMGEVPDLGAPEAADEGLEKGGESFEFSDDEISGIGAEEPSMPGGAPMDDLESASEVEDLSSDDFSSDEFSLGDFGAEFGLMGEEKGPPPAEDERQPEINMPSGASEVIAAAAEGEGFSLSDEDFGRLQKALAYLPLNIKIAVEQIIGEKKASDEDQIKLIRLLVRGESVKAVAAFAGKLIGRTLPIPKGYEKRTGLEFEAEKQTFAYVFRETVLPILKVVTSVLAALALLFFLGYQFVYKPVYAGSLFRRGYALIEQDKYREGNDLFKRAYSIWSDKEWYLTYAALFTEKRQYRYARDKYKELLSFYKDYPHPKSGIRTEPKKDKYFKRAILAYALLESKTLENFEEAEKLLKTLLFDEMYDFEGLLESGDNYMRWGEFVPAKYEEARKTFGVMQERFGLRDEIMFRFLEYFIKTDNYREVLRLKTMFEENKKLKIDVPRYAEMGGYFLDRNEPDEVGTILMRAMAADPRIPDVHYHLARLYKIKDSRRDERIALDNVLLLYGGARPIDRIGLRRYVDTFNRAGELRYKQKEVLEAEKLYKQGIDLYEDALQKRILKNDPVLGRLYVNLGDLYFYAGGDFDEAFIQFQKAETSGVRDPEVNYKKGYIRFRKQDYREALAEFSKTEEHFPANRNLLFAMGNTHFARNNYFAAEGYYSYLLDKLQSDRRAIRTLRPRERDEDRAVVLNTMKLYNNLGVVLHLLGERTRDTEKSSTALVYLTDSSEIYENYSRDPETMVRGDTKNLAHLNMRGILYPRPNYELQIYNAVPLDLKEPVF